MAESSCPSYCLCFWLEFQITWLFYSLYFVFDPLFDHVFYRYLLSIQVYKTLCEQQRYTWCISRGLLLNKVLGASLTCKPWFVTIQLPSTSRWSWRRQWQPTLVLLPGKSHGWRSLVGCSPWGCWESDTTERLHFHFSLSCIGEGNGNPLQYSCLENPRDGGAWWAAIYGVPQSQKWLKWLSSSSRWSFRDRTQPE